MSREIGLLSCLLHCVETWDGCPREVKQNCFYSLGGVKREEENVTRRSSSSLNRSCYHPAIALASWIMYGIGRFSRCVESGYCSNVTFRYDQLWWSRGRGKKSESTCILSVSRREAERAGENILKFKRGGGLLGEIMPSWPMPLVKELQQWGVALKGAGKVNYYCGKGHHRSLRDQESWCTPTQKPFARYWTIKKRKDHEGSSRDSQERQKLPKGRSLSERSSVKDSFKAP